MKASAKFVSAFVMAAAVAVPAQADWSTQLSQPYLGHNEVLVKGMPSAMLEGRAVNGMDGHRLGYVQAVDQANAAVQLKTPGGVAISVPEARLRKFGPDLLALNMTRGDVLATALQQTGQTAATDIDLRHSDTGG